MKIITLFLELPVYEFVSRFTRIDASIVFLGFPILKTNGYMLWTVVFGATQSH